MWTSFEVFYWALVCLLLFIGVGGVLVTALSDWAVGQWMKARHEGTAACCERGPLQPLPPISVLRPVKGLDAGFAENLLSLLAQQYPRFEVLIGVADARDPVVAVAQAIARRSSVPVRVVICTHSTGLNPKVSILEALAKEASYDTLLVSDANASVGAYYLWHLAGQLRDPQVGLVTNVVLGAPANGAGSTLETLQLATFVTRATLFARHFFGHACVVGKSMLFRFSDLQRIGGFSLGRDVLAEDYVIGRAFSSAGYRVALAPDPVAAHAPDWDVERFVNRHQRWAQMRRHLSLKAYLCEPLLYTYPALILGVVATAGRFSSSGWWAVLVTSLLLGKFGLDGRLLRRLYPKHFEWRWLALLVVKDTLVLATWTSGLFVRSIDWRGTRLRIGRGSCLSPLPIQEQPELSLSLSAR